MSYAKARKMAEAEAYRWEQTVKGNAESQGVYTSPLPAPCEAVQTAEEVPEEETFRYFAEQVWMPLKVIAGGARPSTIAMYGFMMRVSLPRLGDKRLKDITAVDIMRYLQYLREEYRAPMDGRCPKRASSIITTFCGLSSTMRRSKRPSKRTPSRRWTRRKLSNVQWRH